MTSPRFGLLVMAYGSPGSVGEIDSYYTHIRRGRPPEPEQLADLVSRYEAIGGISPLTSRTRAQAEAVRNALEAIAPGEFLVVQGHKHAAPFIEEAAAALGDAGLERVVGLVLAPHFSKGSVGQYHDRAHAVLFEAGVEYCPIDRWHDLEPWVQFQAAALRHALSAAGPNPRVVFTAHSLPERVLVGDPYPEELASSAQRIASVVGLKSWELGWQSAGRTPDPWRGPDILELIDETASTSSATGLVVVPQGFTTDHLEVLYDLDIEAADRAHSHGLGFHRTATLNADAATFEALAERVQQRAQSTST